ncbi:hypothetical protein SADUNF_Sadunf16G0303600 [Salix dunnii]|uniref:Uncharacterized protein n=1 Tax=Salix dunnii TaxID=1413687 RepID=A0A835JF16_9ROSI|nr:hypothetical protein SADUNF_Sadunf16G0303600 [Salix dunnii]
MLPPSKTLSRVQMETQRTTIAYNERRRKKPSMCFVDFVGLDMDSGLVFNFMYWVFKLSLRLGFGFIHHVVGLFFAKRLA